MNIRMPQVVREQVEQVLKEILYEEKTVELLDATVRRIEGLVGDGYFVGYHPGTVPGGYKFVLATRLSPDSEYTVWTVSLDPAKWEPEVPPVDPTTPPEEPEEPEQDDKSPHDPVEE